MSSCQSLPLLHLCILQLNATQPWVERCMQARNQPFPAKLPRYQLGFGVALWRTRPPRCSNCPIVMESDHWTAVDDQQSPKEVNWVMVFQQIPSGAQGSGDKAKRSVAARKLSRSGAGYEFVPGYQQGSKIRPFMWGGNDRDYISSDSGL